MRSRNFSGRVSVSLTGAMFSTPVDELAASGRAFLAAHWFMMPYLSIAESQTSG